MTKKPKAKGRPGWKLVRTGIYEKGSLTVTLDSYGDWGWFQDGDKSKGMWGFETAEAAMHAAEKAR